MRVIRSKQLYTLERPVWMDAAGLSKGINHDRQHLDIILTAGQTICVRQVGDISANLTLRLLNDDHHTESSISVGSSWVSLSASAASVPFIDTPYYNASVVVEYEFEDTVKALPVFIEGDDDHAFYNSWDIQQAEFSLIKGKYVNILVPQGDKKALRTLHAENGINILLESYSHIFEFYNALIGISFDSAVYTDRNIPNRYFIKADKHGGGAAYYGSNWTAESTASIHSFWLYPQQPGWGCLHEIAHGYEGHFMSDKYIGISEVWNNILCACYQHVTLGDRQFKEGWLYDYGKQAVVEKVITDYISTDTVVNDWDLRSKLYFFMLMVSKAGMAGFTEFNQHYRQLSNSAGFIATDHALLDMLCESFAFFGERVDVAPFMQKVGAYITPAQREKNHFSSAKAVYPLYLLAEANQLASLQQQLNLQSLLSLVDVDQLSVSGLKGSVTLQLNIDDFSQINGEKIQILNGKDVVRVVPISSTTTVVKDLNIGVYTLRMPTGKNKKYEIQSCYLVVKQGDSTQQVNYVWKKASPLVNQTLVMLGLGDVNFANVSVDHSQSIIGIDVTRRDPHVYFKGQTYAQIVIRDGNNNEIYRRTMEGSDTAVNYQEFAFTVGYKIEVFHAEPDRLRLSPSFEGIISGNAKSTVFEITECGLRNIELNNDPQEATLRAIEQAAESIASHPVILAADYAAAKDNLWLAIMAFTHPLRDTLLTRYHALLPANNKEPEAPEIPEAAEKPEILPYPAWESTRVYATWAERVTYQGKVYQHNFYSINLPPDLYSAPWGQPWIYLFEY
ncbi:putative mucin/carbohydrate-binding domain-containing protein [Pantoea sp. MBD-2R]|uniref:putative mucin/carbohydrate-binding domain-containing protein n=1 Tax=Pantoea sp. MBD-2R TaxID=3141540 RepID=UPI003182F2BB